MRRHGAGDGRKRTMARLLQSITIACVSVALAAATLGGVYVALANPLVAQAAMDYTSIFDPAYYAARYPEVAAAYGTDPAALYGHYAGHGVVLGLSPSAAFIPQYYRSNYPDLNEAFGDDYERYAQHFLLTGRAEGRVADRLLDGVTLIAEETTQIMLTRRTPVTPIAGNYYTTSDPAKIQRVFAAAKQFSFGQPLACVNADVYPGSPVTVYYDDSIVVIAWKELNNRHLCNFMEVVCADGSQFRRKLAGDRYGYPGRLVGTTLSAQADAVAAANADFYMARSVGTSVYDGVLYRFDPSLDTCYITYDGQMLFTYAYELTDRSAAEAFIRNHQVNFALTFGPILVDNGQVRDIRSYRLGEINEQYSRASLGLLGRNHYLVMTFGWEYGYGSGYLAEAAQFMAAKGCQKAYALDGGGTGQIVVGNRLYSRPDYGEERPVSDIIYFASYGNQ